MTGPELKQLRSDLSDALKRELTAAYMAKLCGLPEKGGADTIRRWEVSGPTPSATKVLRGAPDTFLTTAKFAANGAELRQPLVRSIEQLARQGQLSHG